MPFEKKIPCRSRRLLLDPTNPLSREEELTAKTGGRSGRRTFLAVTVMHALEKIWGCRGCRCCTCGCTRSLPETSAFESECGLALIKLSGVIRYRTGVADSLHHYGIGSFNVFRGEL